MPNDRLDEIANEIDAIGVPEGTIQLECDFCGRKFMAANDYPEPEGYTPCLGCLRRKFVRCQHCGKTVLSDDLEEAINGEMYCKSCMENMSQCESCGRIVMDPHERFDRLNWCDSCLNDGRKNSHNYRANTIKKGVKPGKLSLIMGVELEVEDGYVPKMIDWMRRYDPDELKIWQAYDGSLGPAGLEIVSQPATLRYHLGSFPWEKIFTKINEFKFRTTNSCGMHVHTNREWLDGTSAAKVGSFIYANIPQINIIARRTPSRRYARGKLINEHIYESTTTLKDKEGSLYFNNDEGYGPGASKRYEAINFTNVNTIEFRMFKGTTKLNILKVTFEFVDSVCRFSKRYGTSFLIGPDAWKEYIKFVFSQGKLYTEIKNYLSKKGLCK